jgi:hypothetical protein
VLLSDCAHFARAFFRPRSLQVVRISSPGHRDGGNPFYRCQYMFDPLLGACSVHMTRWRCFRFSAMLSISDEGGAKHTNGHHSRPERLEPVHICIFFEPEHQAGSGPRVTCVLCRDMFEMLTAGAPPFRSGTRCLNSKKHSLLPNEHAFNI